MNVEVYRGNVALGAAIAAAIAGGALMLTVIGDLIADVIVLGAALARGRHGQSGRRSRMRAAAAPRMSPPRRRAQSIPVRFIGRVGTDAEGDALVHAARRPRESTCACSAAGRTGSIVILVDDIGGAHDAHRPRALRPSSRRSIPAGSKARGGCISRCTDSSRRPRDAALRSRAMGTGDAASRSASICRAPRRCVQLGAPLRGDLLEALSPAVVFANDDEARSSAIGIGCDGAVRSLRHQARRRSVPLCTGAGRRSRSRSSASPTSSTRRGRATRSRRASSAAALGGANARRVRQGRRSARDERAAPACVRSDDGALRGQEAWMRVRMFWISSMNAL